MLITPYPNEMLHSWRTGRLGCLYMNNYIASKKDSEDGSQLERVTQILSTRPFPERKNLFFEIKKQMISAFYYEDEEQRDLMVGMLSHYIGSCMVPVKN
jgi:hypothetical protein